MKLSKAQLAAIMKLEAGATLHTVKETWHPENTFFKHKDGTCERSNVKVVRKLTEFGIVSEQSSHPLVIDYFFNAEAAKV